MYCGSDTTWATADDLYDRYGDEFVDKLAVRTVWDQDSGRYVADESTEGKLKVIGIALCDARQLMKQKLSCYYSNVDVLEEHLFYSLKQWHIELTIQTLKKGGDCMGCDCVKDMDQYFQCGSICSEDGICLTSKKTFISASVAKFDCECNCKGGCCC